MNLYVFGNENGGRRSVVEKTNSGKTEKSIAVKGQRSRRKVSGQNLRTSLERQVAARSNSAAGHARSMFSSEVVFSRAWALQRLAGTDASWTDMEHSAFGNSDPRSNSEKRAKKDISFALTSPPTPIINARSDEDQTPISTSTVAVSQACTLCGLRGILVCCDGKCRRSFHPGCLGLEALPSQQIWKCAFCSKKPKNTAQSAQSANTRRRGNASTLSRKRPVPKQKCAPLKTQKRKKRATRTTC